MSLGWRPDISREGSSRYSGGSAPARFATAARPTPTIATRPDAAWVREALDALLDGHELAVRRRGRRGLVSVVAVLGALYPATTILLARVVLRERVQRIRQAGNVAVLCGVALIAAG